MNVFDRIPNDFFNLLASGSNNRMHADCLLKIYELFEDRISYKISWNVVRDVIASYLMTECSVTQGDDVPNAKAAEIIRTFSDSCWLMTETDDITYERQVVMTDAGISLAKLLIEFVKPSKDEYSAYVFNIYNCLTNENQWQDNLYASVLSVVYTNMKSLSDALKKLSTSIKSIIKQMTDEKSLEDLTAHLTSYCEGDFIKNYSRLIKEQNIHLYRRAILNKLEWMRDDSDTYEKLIIGCMDEDDLDEYAATNHINNLFDYMSQFLRNDYDSILSHIRQDIISYLNLAVSRANFLREHSSDDNAVIGVVKRMVKAFNEDEEFDCSNLFELYTHEFIDLSSIRARNKSKEITTATIVDAVELDQDDIDEVQANMTKMLDDPLLPQNVGKRIQKAMSHRAMLPVKDLPIENKDDFLFVFSAIAYAEKNGMSVDIKDDYVRCGSFVIRDFTFLKKGDKNNG